MKKIYIRFPGDNDFVNTLSPFVKALAENIFYLRGWENITKEQVVKLFNEHAFAFYSMYQCYKIEADEAIKDYLKISIKDVYFDDEAQFYLDSNDWNQDGYLAQLDHDGNVVLTNI